MPGRASVAGSSSPDPGLVAVAAYCFSAFRSCRLGEAPSCSPTRVRCITRASLKWRYGLVDFGALGGGRRVAVEERRSADAIGVRQSLELTHRFGSRFRAHHGFFGLLAQIVRQTSVIHQKLAIAN